MHQRSQAHRSRLYPALPGVYLFLLFATNYARSNSDNGSQRGKNPHRGEAPLAALRRAAVVFPLGFRFPR